MKKLKAKLTAILASVCCVFAMLGVGVVIANSQTATVKAATNYTISSVLLSTSSSSSTAIYAYPKDTSEKPSRTITDFNGDGTIDDGDNWYTAFTGGTITFNGVQCTTYELKQPGDFYITFGATATNGDVLYIDGTFTDSNTNTGDTITFDNCALLYNGSTWEGYRPYNLGTLTVSNESNSTGKNTEIYLDSANYSTLPLTDWSYFDISSGGTFSGATLEKIQTAGEGLYVGFSAVTSGTTITISGTFTHSTENIKYTIEESSFTWNGSYWEEVINYTVEELGTLTIGGDSNSTQVYLNRADGETFNVYTGEDSWDAKFTVVDGAGIVLNGTTLSTDDIKFPNCMFVGLGTTPATDDILTISGTFANDDYAVKYVVEESKFQWNGEAWVDYVEATEYKLGTLTVSNESNSTGKNTEIYLDSANYSTLPLTDWSHFDISSGGTFSGATLEKIQTAGEGLYVGFSAVTSGTTITISGTFTHATQPIKYTIEESSFTWNGSYWEVYVETVTYNYSGLTVASPSYGSDAQSGQLYLENADDLPIADWDTKFTLTDVTNENCTITEFKSPDNNWFFFCLSGVTVGTAITIGGTFTYPNLVNDVRIVYEIEDSTFTWNGKTWVSVYTDDVLEYYDEVTITDLEKEISETVTSNGTHWISTNYAKSVNNTTGSVKFRLGVNSNTLTTDLLELRLRYTAWWGYKFTVENGAISLIVLQDDNTHKHILTSRNDLLTNGQDVVLEFGAIDMTDGNVWIYISVDDVIYASTVIAKTTDSYDASGFTTSLVSLYVTTLNSSSITFFDPDHVKVTYTHSGGSFYEYAPKDGEYTLASARSTGAFVGWGLNGSLYGANEVYTTGDDDLTFTAVELDFKMDEGASILISNSSDLSGIRFTALLSESELDDLISTYGATVKYGMLIIPYDYLRYNQAPNLDDFSESGTTEDKDLIVKLPSNMEVQTVENGYIVYRGAMRKMYESNFERLFAGRGYIEITIGGKTITVYTPFDVEDNVRSIKYVAQNYQATSEYAGLDSDKQMVVSAYANKNVTLTNYSKYQANEYFSATAWYYPELNESNGYNNDDNIAIATKMKEAGIKVVYLDGMYHLTLDTQVNIEKTRQIIEFFWSQGLYTIAYASSGDIDFNTIQYPDYSDCEGFIGFLDWDEPATSDYMSTLATRAENFEKTYAGTGVTYMVNLLPSYAGTFNGTTNFWESSVDSLDADSYKSYLESYVNTVLSKVSGEKWLSMDSYPINADGTLTFNFLFDLAMLKYYSLSAGATSHAVLQSSGWTEGEYDSKSAMPTEAQLKMQAYTAMAFGIDSISWWSYSDKREDNQNNPTDNDTYYNYFKNANTELANVSAIYKAFNWKGVILGTGKDNGVLIFSTDYDYEAFNLVANNLDSEYILIASSTKNLSNVAIGDTDKNYLMGVMEDIYGNEGYVLVNYNNFDDNSETDSQTITITFGTNVTEVIIYQDGVATTQTVTNKTLAVTLTTGEGVIILPSQIG